MLSTQLLFFFHICISKAEFFKIRVSEVLRNMFFVGLLDISVKSRVNEAIEGKMKIDSWSQMRLRKLQSLRVVYLWVNLHVEEYYTRNTL